MPTTRPPIPHGWLALMQHDDGKAGTHADYSLKTQKALEGECRERGLKVTILKADYVKKLQVRAGWVCEGARGGGACV